MATQRLLAPYPPPHSFCITTRCVVLCMCGHGQALAQQEVERASEEAPKTGASWWDTALAQRPSPAARVAPEPLQVRSSW